jgi:ADP-ribosylglycohydrolase
MRSAHSEKICSALYGHAVGDALGLGTEFLTKSEIAELYPDGLQDYAEIVQDDHRSRWPVGAWTDDTDHMLCLVDSMVEHGQIVTVDIGRRLQDWVINGGMGVGRTVSSVVQSPGFLRQPRFVAQSVWFQTGRQFAANGGVMRTTPIGLWRWWDRDQTEKNAEHVCQITHFDPRCVASCVAICDMLAQLVSGKTDISEVVESAATRAAKYHLEAGIWMRAMFATTLGDLHLSEGLEMHEPDRIGYTYKTLAAATWALIHAPTVESALQSIIQEGGDADTNAAVAGGLLGAKFGSSAYLNKKVNQLREANLLKKKVKRFVDVVDRAFSASRVNCHL